MGAYVSGCGGSSSTAVAPPVIPPPTGSTILTVTDVGGTTVGLLTLVLVRLSYFLY